MPFVFSYEEERSVWLQGKVFSIVFVLITARRGQWNPRVPLGRHLLQAQLTHKEPGGFLNNRVELNTYDINGDQGVSEKHKRTMEPTTHQPED